MTAGRSLVTRLDSMGDVLLAGPAIRALAALGPVDVLCSHRGVPAAALLPDVDDIVLFDAPWVLREAPPIDPAAVEDLVRRLSAAGYTRTAVLTSSHQSALPMALLLRLAGVPEIAAVSLDHAGRLLDHRIPGDPDVHEVERALLVVAALGAPVPAQPRLAVVAATGVEPQPGRLVVHAGAAAPARTLAVEVWREVVAQAVAAGWDVVVTGEAAERALVDTAVGASGARPLIPSTLGELATTLAAAAVVVSGNTGPMHLAAAVGRPVVVPFAPTVPATRWAPWGVPHVLLGDVDVACRGCRHVSCPIPGQPCLADVDAAAVLAAAHSLSRPLEVAR